MKDKISLKTKNILGKGYDILLSRSHGYGTVITCCIVLFQFVAVCIFYCKLTGQYRKNACSLSKLD